MARAIVLTFEDNAEAEEYLETFNRARKQTGYEGKGAFIALMVAIPTQFCEGCRTGKRVKGYARGTKFGWWVCEICHKPSWATPMKVLRACLSQAVNLLEGGEKDVHEVFDEGWGAYSRG